MKCPRAGCDNEMEEHDCNCELCDIELVCPECGWQE